MLSSPELQTVLQNARRIQSRYEAAGKNPLPQIVGIANITPDSFSDGGLSKDTDRALEHIVRLAKQGAQIIDIGAESTRPGASLLSHRQEWERLEPVLQNLKDILHNGTLISLDSRHPETVEKALNYGIDWINDVSGLRNPSMLEIAKNTDTDIVLMHNLGIPTSKENTLPEDADPVQMVLVWAENKLERLEAAGIDRERIIFDPGIGFGKTPTQSLDLIRDARRVKELGVRVLYGHSRKSFLSKFNSSDIPSERDAETCTVSLYLARQEVDYLRVHNVDANLKTLKVMQTIEDM